MYHYAWKEITSRSLQKPVKVGSDLTLLGREFQVLDAK